MLKRLPADALTGLSLLFGMASVYAAFHDHFDFAAWLIYAAAIADAGDGWMARRRGVANNVGLFRDTVVDAVVFGGFSSILMWRAVLDPFISSEKPLVALIAVAALFVFAFRGLWRLARFIDMTLRQKPLRESAEPQTKDLFFFGMPIPAGASVLAAFVLSMDRLPATWNASAGALEIGILSGIATAGLTATATLMDLPYPALNRLLSFVKKHFMLSGIAVALAVFAALHSLPAIAMAGVVVTAMAAIAMLTKLPYPALGWFYKSIVNYPLRSAVVVVAALAAYLMLHSIYLLGLAGLSAYMLGPMVRYFYQRTLRRPIRRMLRHPLESKSETPSQTPRPG